jgi:hypothetical protein
MLKFKVPTLFWQDHADRKPCDGDPDVEMARVVHVGRRYTVIEGTPAQIETLRADAAFYCHPDGPGSDDPAYRGLRASAAATLRAILEAHLAKLPTKMTCA